MEPSVISIFRMIGHDGRTRDKQGFPDTQWLASYGAACAVFVHRGELAAFELYECEDIGGMELLSAAIEDGRARLVLRFDQESLARSIEFNRIELGDDGFVDPLPGDDDEPPAAAEIIPFRRDP